VAGWLVLLVVTNGLTLGVLWLRWRRRRDVQVDGDEVFVAPRPAGVSTRSRRLITVEVLNPIDLVGTRGRVAGLAGSLAPGLARRVVYDQLLKTLRRELAAKHVVADVRLHQLRPVATEVPSVPDISSPVIQIDEVTTVDLDVETDQL
jgi:hypothetical protein